LWTTRSAFIRYASGVPYDMKYIAVKGDLLADINENLAAEQKARVTTTTFAPWGRPGLAQSYQISA
jgi:Mn-containing catalase